MHTFFADTRAVGFDLDQTLYQDTPEIKNRIRIEVLKKILEAKPELTDVDATYEQYEKRCLELQSWPKVFEEIGIKNSRAVFSACLASANIADFITHDERIATIIRALSQKYFLFLITGSSQKDSHVKLEKIGIEPSVFSIIMCGDDERGYSKSDGSCFQYIVSQSGYASHKHVYIGDNPTTDISIPKSLGMKTIAVGTYEKAADYSVVNILQIEDLLL